MENNRIHSVPGYGVRITNLLWMLAVAAMCFLCACQKTEAGKNTEQLPRFEETSQGKEDENTEGNTGDSVSVGDTLEKKTFTPEKQYVKYIGRNVMYKDVLWVPHTAGGIEFEFFGTSAGITISADSTLTGGLSDRARFAIYVNGERVIDTQIKKMLNTYEVFSADEPETVTVRVVKLSEAGNSTMGIKSIDVTCVGDIRPTEEKKVRLEFIGDSITCGYGVDDEVKEHHFSTATEDGTKTYAYKTAVNLDADYSMVCYSGHGIISGYSGDGTRVTTQLIPEMYDEIARTRGKIGDYVIGSENWDFSQYRPDVVIINLGTNDDSYVKGKPERKEEYINGYVAFLMDVREKNPDAYLLCTLGIMGDNLYASVEKAVDNYKNETGDEKVSAFHFTPQNGSLGYAADWHPTEATHEAAAKALTEKLKDILGE